MKINKNLFFQDKLIFNFSLFYLGILILWYLLFLNNGNFLLIYNLEPTNFYFEPYISIYLLEIFKSSNFLPLLSFFNIVLFPYLILYLLYNVYLNFVEKRYAFLLSLISISIFTEQNFRDFLGHILEFNVLENYSLINFPLIFRFPFPSISILVFLLLFQFIINNKTQSHLKNLFITIFTSTFFYINALDALFIIFLWFFVLITKCFKTKKTSSIREVIAYFVVNLIILTPGLIDNSLGSDHEYLSSNNYYYNLFLYNFLPLFLSFLFFKIKRIDPYEVWFKFKFVYLFLILEVVINFIVYSQFFIIDLNILNKQVLQFVIHLLYYTPIIYYISRQSYNYRFGSESSELSLGISNLFFRIFVKTKSIIFYILIVLLLIFNFPLMIFL